MSDSFLRKIRILQLLKNKADGYITIPEIVRDLSHQGFDEVKSRTIERDMTDLSRNFAIGCDNTKRPFHWWWESDESIEIPTMGRNTALTFSLAEQHLEPLLLGVSLKYLKPKFKQVGRILTSKDKNKERQWLNKIRVLPHAVNLVPAQISDKIHHTVYDALYEEKMLEFKYYAPSKDKTTARRVHPLALIYRGITTELIACDEKDNHVKRFILNRMKQAKLQIQQCKIPDGFNLDDFIQKEMGFPASCEKITLKAWIAWDAKNKLIETPLSPYQTVKETDNNAIIIEAPVIDTNELTTWILGLGARIKILEPDSLKEKIAGIIEETHRLYQNQ